MNKALLDHWQEEQELRACFCLLHSILVEVSEGPNEIDEENLLTELWFIIERGEHALNNLFRSEVREVDKNE